MALNINTNLTNNLDGYLVDAKNVKGTYVVVQFQSDLADLPSACKVSGSIAYVVNPDGEGSNYFKYDGISSWNPVILETKYISASINDNFSIKDYTFNMNSLTLGYVLERNVALSDIVISFNNDIAIFFSLNGVSNTSDYTIKTSQLLVYDNKQYVATLNIDVSQQSNNATLTFQELQASGGGGGSGDGSIYTFRIKINTPPVYVEQGSFSTIDEYVGYYIFDNDEYILVTNDNKNSLGIVPNTTLYYEQNTLPNTPYSYLYFDINEVYFNDSNVIKDLNAMLESAGVSTLDSLDDLPTYWNSVDISAKSFLVNTISSMGNNFKREFGSNDLDEDGFYSVANYTYLQSSSSNDSIRWDGYTIGNSTYTDLNSYANDGIMEYVGKTGGGSSSGGGSQPVATQQKWYEWTLHTETSLNVSDNRLEFRIKEEQFNEFLVAVNQVMSQQDPTWTNITDKTGLIALFNTLKANASDSTIFQMIVTLFGVAKYSIINNHENVLFWVQDQSNIDYGSFYVVDVVTCFDIMYALKIRNYSAQSAVTGIITNDSTDQDSLLYINSNSTLSITETYD